MDDQVAVKDEFINRITSIFFFFTQTESYVKELIASKNVFRSLFRCYNLLNDTHQLTVLKFIKNLSSVPSNFIVLQNSNSIENLVNILIEARDYPQYKEIASQILHIMFNLCRLSKERQEEAAIAGIVPILQEVVLGDSPLKQFASPILCDMAYAGKVCRKILWQHDGLSTYLYLSSDPYWQVNAYDAIAVWLEDEVARVEERLIQPSCRQRLLEGIFESKTNSLNSVLDSFNKILRLSPGLCRAISLPNLLAHVKRRLKSSKAIVQLNLLRVVRTILELNPNQCRLLEQIGIASILQSTTTAADSPVLVKELAKELLAILASKVVNDRLAEERTMARARHNGSPVMRSPTKLLHQARLGAVSPLRRK
jgi:hypothetical protein